MDLSQPIQSLLPAVDSAVLAVLAGSTKPRTGREIARLADRSQAATQRVLDRLVAHGVVLRKEAGRARIYELNRAHLASQPIIDLVDLRGRLISGIRYFISLWRISPSHASIFGSAARGDGDLDSDVDIFLVRPRGIDEENETWREQVAALAEAVFAMSGNHAGIAEVDEEELEHLRHDRPPIVESLRADAVDIAGTPLRTLLRRIRI